MALKNNKGFSLIEIVIAIAILTLLLTPIMRQFTQTMRTSRLAKEQQYANEEAVYTLEDAQMETASELDAAYGVASPVAVTCKLYDATTGNEITSVNYTVKEYDLGEVEIGARNTKYQKTLLIDDLSTNIRGYKDASGDGLTIDYSVTDVSGLSGFEITNEGSGVHYNNQGYIDGIICKEAEYVGNPNEVNLGNMQNLDKDTVAIINGDSAEYDAQADSALYAQAMDELKEVDPVSWKQAFENANGQSVLTQGSYNIDKLTKVYVEKLNDAAAGKDFYRVKADVYYSSIITVDVTIDGDSVSYEIDGKLQYNVFSQDFYTAECPDIYFEYQPYIEESTGDSSSGYNVRYTPNDYILLDSDVPDVKLYLYKPFKDAMNVAANVTDADYLQQVQTFTTTSGGDNVKIHLAKVDGSENVRIYTNLNTELDPTKTHQFEFDDLVKMYTDENGSLVSKKVFTDVETDITTKTTSTKVPFVAVDPSDSTNVYLKSIQDDARYDSRLQSITVTMEPVTENVNTVRLTGAKGEK